MSKFLVAALAALAIAIPAGAAENSTTHSTTPFAGSTVNPCNGEPIQYVGTCQTVVKTHETNNGTDVRTHTVCEAHGVSPDRTIYRFLTQTAMATGTTDGCGFEEKFEQRMRVVSFGKEQNFFVTAGFHVRVNENCEVEVASSEFEPECRSAGDM